VDDDSSNIFAGYWISQEDQERPGDFEARLAAAKLALPDDIRIWEHQIYLEPPGLATSEAAGFRALRRWASSFYPKPRADAVTNGG
jgi:3-ketosteroid 9alpha-monooxygenase subunit A